MKQYFWNILISFDQSFNTLTGGDPDETLSSRAGKLISKERWAYYLCRFLNLFQKGHCQKSLELDEGSNAVIK